MSGLLLSLLSCSISQEQSRWILTGDRGKSSLLLSSWAISSTLFIIEVIWLQFSKMILLNSAFLRGGNIFRCDQVGKSVDRVQRRANFVAHVLDEGILHLFTFLCFFAGKDDQAVRLLQFLI